MTLIIPFPSRVLAERHAEGLGRSSAFTGGGRPVIDKDKGRCDSYKWGDPNVVHGRRLARLVCPCVARDTPDPSCPYLTTAATEVLEFGRGSFAIVWVDGHDVARGEVVLVRGVGVTITDVGVRARRPTDVDVRDTPLP